MLNQISLERVQELQAEIDQINKMNIRDMVITKDGKPVEISQRMRDDMRFTGLNTFGLLKEIDKNHK